MSINLQVVSATGWAVGRFEVTERNTRKQGIPETITGKAGLARNAPGTRFRSVQSPLDPVTHLNQRRGPSNRYDVLTCTVEVLGAKGSLGNRSWLEYEQFLSPEPGHLVLIITGLPTARMNIIWATMQKYRYHYRGSMLPGIHAGHLRAAFCS